MGFDAPTFVSFPRIGRRWALGFRRSGSFELSSIALFSAIARPYAGPAPYAQTVSLGSSR